MTYHSGAGVAASAGVNLVIRIKHSAKEGRGYFFLETGSEYQAVKNAVSQAAARERTDRRGETAYSQREVGTYFLMDVPPLV